MKPWKVILAALVIFASGIVTGALISSHRPVPATAPVEGAAANKPTGPAPLHPLRAELLRKIEKNLNLSVDQKQKIEKIMHQSQERTRPLWDQIAPQMHEETLRVREEIRAELTPEQQQKFETLLKDRPKPDGAPPERRHRSKPEATNATPDLKTNRQTPPSP